MNNSNDYWEWAHSTLISELRAQAHYNGQPPYGLRGFIGDHVNRIMGYAILRQIRVVPNSCRYLMSITIKSSPINSVISDYRVSDKIHSMTQECAAKSAVFNEDDRNYCNAWVEQNELTVNLVSTV